MAPPRCVLVSGIVTVARAGSLRYTDTLVTLPSSTVRSAAPSKNTSVTGPSSSASATVAVGRAPATNPSGSGPKPIRTLSPSSSTESSVAVTVNVSRVCPAWNVTLGGTPE